MNKTIITSVAVASLLLVGCVIGANWLVGDNQSATLAGSRFPNGLSADSTSASAGQVRGTTLTVTGAATLSGDVTVGGGTFDVTTSNSATSTLIAGCFQFYATSTDTAQKFQASTTPGAMYSSYGSCPND